MPGLVLQGRPPKGHVEDYVGRAIQLAVPSAKEEEMHCPLQKTFCHPSALYPFRAGACLSQGTFV